MHHLDLLRFICYFLTNLLHSCLVTCCSLQRRQTCISGYNHICRDQLGFRATGFIIFFSANTWCMFLAEQVPCFCCLACKNKHISSDVPSLRRLTALLPFEHQKNKYQEWKFKRNNNYLNHTPCIQIAHTYFARPL